MKPFGPYLLLEELAAGGSGVVSLAVERNARELLVVKRLHEGLASDPDAVSRLRHEAAVAVSVDSPHVVRVHGVGAVGGQPFIAMQHVPGCTVARMLVHFSKIDAQLPIGMGVAFIADALRGLAALHSAVHPKTREPLAAIHRDISPRNLMITPDARLVLIDLGLGKSNLRDWATRTGVLMGTPGYLAPEQITKGSVDHRADLYALGVVGFEILTVSHYVKRGEAREMFEECLSRPFIPPSSRRSSIPPALDRVFERALAERPEDRYASADDMLVDLLRAAPEERPGASAFPEELLREVSDAAERMKSLLVPTVAELPPEDATEIYARRDEGVTRTKPMPVPSRPRRARHVAPLLVAAVVLGFGIGYRAYTRPDEAGGIVAIEPPPPIAAPAVSVTARPDDDFAAGARSEPRASEVGRSGFAEVSDPPRVDRIRPVDRRIEPPRRRAEAPIADKPPKASEAGRPASAGPGPEDFDALMRRAASLKARRPELSRALDALILDATMWRTAEPSDRTRAAWSRLVERLAEIEASS
jgi:serine/threonine-protein kinase